MKEYKVEQFQSHPVEVGAAQITEVSIIESGQFKIKLLNFFMGGEFTIFRDGKEASINGLKPGNVFVVWPNGTESCMSMQEFTSQFKRKEV
ncbi:hypothetical protein TROPICALSUN_50 [Erwinia phage vB_EamM_TropicalSun]|uniref:Uncharacterized protein n=2 Tax=Myosmarvirus myosmar TaxID=2846183 RepID=A0A5B9NNU5_9CAUD|nr:hypothetical protein HWC56_gp045 [Serratia phage MyoSmar]QEG09494.1 hypothetical protein CPT_MyoSmar_045 [Serratia phage MyoSmar]QEG13840.1 hypothetical protein TROPICALSUN_50 [Erwinia phage vB_EamM_TropicalSun]